LSVNPVSQSGFGFRAVRLGDWLTQLASRDTMHELFFLLIFISGLLFSHVIIFNFLIHD